MDNLVESGSMEWRAVRRTAPLRAARAPAPPTPADPSPPVTPTRDGSTAAGAPDTSQSTVSPRMEGMERALQPVGDTRSTAENALELSTVVREQWSAMLPFVVQRDRRADAADGGARPSKWTTGGPLSGAPSARNGAGGKPRFVLARAVFVLILALNLLGIGALRAVDTVLMAQRDTADLNVHLTRLEQLLQGGGLPQVSQLGTLVTEMAAADTDLRSLDGLLPFSGDLPIAQETAAHHALQLGIDALDAGQSTILLATQLAPSVQALVATFVHGPTAALPPNTHLFTVGDQAAAQAIINNRAIPSWQAALADRARLSPGDLAVLHNQQLSSFIKRFDEFAPKISVVLQTAKQLVDASPRLVGIEKPEHLLLLNMDTDELRATGGFLGNYADLQLVNGALVSGVHLHDVYTLDCPNNLCPNNPVPPQDAWFTIAGGKLGMRDANLDPDFPTAAAAIESFYQHESGVQVDGVIAITPAVITSVLQVTGPILVPQFGVTVTAANLRDLLHYYHQNPQIAEQLGISAPALGTSIFKVFDVLAAQAVLAHLQALTPSQQINLGRALLQDLSTKDIQVFSNVEHVQDLIVATGVGGHVATAPFDSLAVVDTNDGATYSNADMRESVVDHVALGGASGAAQVGVQGATHTLSITYDFPVVAHPYTQFNTYADFVRVLVPKNATKLVVGGPCTAFAVTEADHQVLSCQFSLKRGSSTTLRFSWTVPNPKTAQGALLPYSLLVARQPGAVVQTQVSIAPPTGATLDPTAGPGAIQKGALVWTANPLTSDTTLHAPLAGEGASA